MLPDHPTVWVGLEEECDQRGRVQVSYPASYYNTLLQGHWGNIVKTCLGTETPLRMPLALRERLKAQGKDPADPAVVCEVYRGIFRRIGRSHSLDTYWLWTPQGWTWGGNSPRQLSATVADVNLAYEALGEVGSPFGLATSGWVLEPKENSPISAVR